MDWNSNYGDHLFNSPLFKGIDRKSVEMLLKKINFQIKRYRRDDVIALSGDECKSLGIVLKGSVRGEMINMKGGVLKIEDITEGRPIAVAFLFGNRNFYPVTITANEDVTILSLPLNSVISLIQLNSFFLNNFMDAVSNRAQFISNKLKFLSFKSLKSKIALYLLEQDIHKKGSVILKSSHEELSELFGVTRPSLSRTIRVLDKEGVIDAKGKHITINRRNELMNLL
ncbi:Crp/Fnr family transcriptional regulator [Marinilabiliaceae bacterium ANBcel2]|nr:Crp/Fnr family transcriptional regulator [Marinilabiliaceae bacterium ANBcel2]